MKKPPPHFTKRVINDHITVLVSPAWSEEMVASFVAEVGIRRLAQLALAGGEPREAFTKRVAESAAHFYDVARLDSEAAAALQEQPSPQPPPPSAQDGGTTPPQEGDGRPATRKPAVSLRHWEVGPASDDFVDATAGIRRLVQLAQDRGGTLLPEETGTGDGMPPPPDVRSMDTDEDGG